MKKIEGTILESARLERVLLERIDRTAATLTEEMTMSDRNITSSTKEKQDKMIFDQNKRFMEIEQKMRAATLEQGKGRGHPAKGPPPRQTKQNAAEVDDSPSMPRKASRNPVRPEKTRQPQPKEPVSPAQKSPGQTTAASPEQTTDAQATPKPDQDKSPIRRQSTLTKEKELASVEGTPKAQPVIQSSETPLLKAASASISAVMQDEGLKKALQ